MRIIVSTIAVAALGTVIMLMAACGGGDGGAGKGPRITDPKLVPSSTPITNPLTFKIKNDVISVEGTQGTVRPGTPQAGQARSHTVKPGDTCAGIAAQFQITVDALRAANRAIDASCSNLREGDVLKIPAAPTPTPSGPATSGTPRLGAKEYVVVDGDTCAAIAARVNVAVADIIRLNNLDANCVNLKIGQVLKLP